MSYSQDDYLKRPIQTRVSLAQWGRIFLLLLLASAAILIPFWFSLGTFRPDSLDGRSSPTPTPVDFANSTRANDPEFWSLVDEAVVQCRDRFHHSKRSPLIHATAIERDDEPIKVIFQETGKDGDHSSYYVSFGEFGNRQDKKITGDVNGIFVVEGKQGYWQIDNGSIIRDMPDGSIITFAAFEVAGLELGTTAQ